MRPDSSWVVRWLRRRARNIIEGSRGLGIEILIVLALVLLATVTSFVVLALT